jgi:hypothetical protein
LERIHPTISACGIDCGLCPRYYTVGDSRCPGCGGTDFHLKHPSCKILNCVMRDHHVTSCSECNEFPCEIIASWDQGDSFVSHLNCLHNLSFIKKHGYDAYLENQSKRVKLLEELLQNYDHGRSKSYYCLSMTLLSIDSINQLNQWIINTDQIRTSNDIHERIETLANKDSVVLKLRKIKS